MDPVTNPVTQPNPNPPTPPAPPPAPQSEIEKERDRVLAEAADLRKKLKLAEDGNTAKAAELDGLKKQGFKNSGDWQKLAETLQAENAELNTKMKATTSAFVETLRLGAVKQEVLKMNIRAEALDDLEGMSLEGVPVEIENGKFNVKGADAFAKNLKTLKPYMFKDGTPPNINAGNPGGPGQKVDLATAQKAYQTAYSNRRTKPEEFKIAQATYKAAIDESRKAKK